MNIRKNILLKKKDYLDAIYTGPTVRYIGLDLSDPLQRKLLDNNLNIFVSDSEYREYLTPDHQEKKPEGSYGDIIGRILCGERFYGVGGCATLKETSQYAFSKSGVYIGINTLENDSHRIKLVGNKLYQTIRNSSNPCGYEKEILHVYLDDEGSILKSPGDKPKQSFAPYVAWAIDAREYDIGRRNPKNLLKPGETVDLDLWYQNELRKAKKQQPSATEAMPAATHRLFSSATETELPRITKEEYFASLNI